MIERQSKKEVLDDDLLVGNNEPKKRARNFENESNFSWIKTKKIETNSMPGFNGGRTKKEEK